MKGRDPFCRSGIEGEAFLLTKHMMVLYNIAPVLPGHCLIVPLRHVESVEGLRPAEIQDLFKTVKRIVPVLSRAYGDGSDSYIFLAHSGPFSGRGIGHVHFHIVPRGRKDRYAVDGGNVVLEIEKARRLSDKEIYKEVKRLRKEFATK